MFTDVVVPAVNTIFANGIAFPSVDGLTLSNATIAYGPQYFTVASDFTFAPNMTVPQVAILPAIAADRFKLRHGN
jgi:hypothetical protein